MRSLLIVAALLAVACAPASALPLACREYAPSGTEACRDCTARVGNPPTVAVTVHDCWTSAYGA